MPNQPQQEPTILKILVGVPGYLLSYLGGFVIAILTDVTSTSMALASFFVGYSTNVWAGLATFFLIHTFIKIVNATNGALIQSGRVQANQLRNLAMIFNQTKVQEPALTGDPPAQDTPEG